MREVVCKHRKLQTLQSKSFQKEGVLISTKQSIKADAKCLVYNETV